MIVHAPVGAQFAWYAYDTVSLEETSNFGCVIYNESGTQVVADLSRKLMRIVTAFTIVYNGDNSDITLPAGRNYAVSISHGGRMQPVSAGASVLLYNGAAVNGNIIRRSIFQIAAISASSVAQTRVSYCLALDVTNY
ncbi:hypothetical protein [[Pseudomonas] boreopolis]|uniref:Uncharacterized protein n=1 Tax=Xanthomonas boreopolis TaxID=86183 RepID=A0A919F7H1_9XANT|nr:hypothetical protein GCM10009090_16680 [[Pseudomonas] boreopolis]